MIVIQISFTSNIFKKRLSYYKCMLSSHNLNFFLAILLQLLINYKGYDFPSIFKKMIITAFLKVHVNVLLKRNNFNSKKDKILLFIRNPL